MCSKQGNVLQNGYGLLLLWVFVFFFYIENRVADQDNWGGYKVLFWKKGHLFDTRTFVWVDRTKISPWSFFESKRVGHDF